MNARRIFVYIVVILILVALGFLIKILYFDPLVKDTSDDSAEAVTEEPEEIKDCFFLNTDIINERVYNKEGEKITETDFTVPCKKCKNFTYVDKEGCSSYMTDSRYTANGSQKVCTSLEYPEKCDEKLFPQKSSSNDTGSPEPSNLP